jgi:hypothetical protein
MGQGFLGFGASREVFGQAAEDESVDWIQEIPIEQPCQSAGGEESGLKQTRGGGIDGFDSKLKPGTAWDFHFGA